MAEREIPAAIPFGVPLPFIEHLGITMHRLEGGQSELRYLPRTEHRNTHEITHGGVILTLMDVAMGSAARSAEAGMTVVTVELKCSFMRPADGPLVARGQVLSRSRRMAFMEARVFDAQDQLCAHATGTFKYVPPGSRAASPAPEAG